MAAEFEGWAIVELMGHRKLAGRISEVTLAGAAMLRLDIPSDPPVTQYYPASSLYCLTPTTEALATKVAKASRPTPVNRYELASASYDEAPWGSDDDDDDDRGDEVRAEIAEARDSQTDIDEQRAAGARGLGK